MKRYLNCYDTHSCVRCFSCMTNCSVENRVRLQRDQHIPSEQTANHPMHHLNYLMPRLKEFGVFPKARQIIEFHHCMHCENHPCLDICPAFAIVKRPSGAVVILEERCVGCRSCIDACPYDVPVYNPETNKTYKCILCFDRIENGLVPACVEACPTGAMFSGPEDEVLKEANERASFYTERYGEPYVVYGAQRLNGYVGRTGWLTIVPEADLEAYGLPQDPVKSAAIMRGPLKVGGAGLAGLTALACTGHFLYWLYNRKLEVARDQEGRNVLEQGAEAGEGTDQGTTSGQAKEENRQEETDGD